MDRAPREDFHLFFHDGLIAPLPKRLAEPNNANSKQGHYHTESVNIMVVHDPFLLFLCP
jgi:hypothetical protein